MGGLIMKKDHIRKRISKIYRKYIRLGLYRSQLTPFEVCQRIRGSCHNASLEKDLFAFWELCRFLELEDKRDVLRAFYCIYVKKDVWKEDTDSKILQFAFENYCDSRTVYLVGGSLLVPCSLPGPPVVSVFSPLWPAKGGWA